MSDLTDLAARLRTQAEHGKEASLSYAYPSDLLAVADLAERVERLDAAINEVCRTMVGPLEPGELSGIDRVRTEHRHRKEWSSFWTAFDALVEVAARDLAVAAKGEVLDSESRPMF